MKAFEMDETGDVYTWGRRVLGETEGNSVSPLPLSLHLPIQAISCGHCHSAFLTSTGQVYTFGENRGGQLGLGVRSDRGTQPCLVPNLPWIAAVSCGFTHTLAVTEGGLVYSWGSGALGNGSLGTQLTPILVPLPVNYQATSVSAGLDHSAILGTTIENQGQLLVFGSGDKGQLGTGRSLQELYPVPVPQSTAYTQVACGWLFTLVIASDGAVFSCGTNEKGQLGTRIARQRATFQPINGLSAIRKVVAGHYSAAIDSSGQAYIWGSSPLGESLVPVPIPLPRSLTDISIGPDFGLGVDSTGQVWAWGRNEAGQLGLGDYGKRTVPHVVLGIGKAKTAICGGNWVFATAKSTANAGETSWESTEAGLSSSTREQKSPSFEQIFQQFEASEDSLLTRDIQATLCPTKEPVTSHMLISSLQCELARRSAEVASLQSIVEKCRLELEEKSREIREVTMLLELRAQEIDQKQASEALKNEQFETVLKKLNAAENALASANSANNKIQNELETAKSTAKHDSEVLNSHISELQAQLSRNRQDHQILYEAWCRTEAHNQSLLQSLEHKSLLQAQNYRTRTQPYVSRSPLQPVDLNSAL